jgi:NDP-sugar pyrophosphorylase family protein
VINIVVPMAGAGSRFVAAGYDRPKPFIDVAGTPMIVRVLENLASSDARFLLLARTDHLEQEADLVREIERDYQASFIAVEQLTEGTACTVLHARALIDNDTPLLIANSDQIVDFSVDAFIADCHRRQLDGSILTFIDRQQDPKWSFAKIDAEGLVTEVQEKKPISMHATVGIYYYRSGHDFVAAAIDMIVRNDRVNREFYTCPTYNYAIRNGARIGIYDIAPEKMHGLGTPEDLNLYLRHLGES